MTGLRARLGSIPAALVERRDHAPALILVTLGTVAVSRAMSLHQRGDRIQDGPWLLTGLLLLTAALLLPRGDGRLITARGWDRLLRLAIGAGIAWGAYELLTVRDALPFPSPAGRLLEGDDARALVVMAAILAISGLRERPPFGRLQLPLLIGVFAVLGAWFIHVFQDPPIDVWVWQKLAVEHLLAGGNPYAMDFPNIYPDTGYYPPGLVVDGRVQAPYPYPPITLWAYLPAQLLLGDPRYANLIALLVGAALIGAARPGPLARGAVGLLLLAPTSLFILRFSWTEPITVATLGLTLFAALRSPRFRGIGFGVFIATKQYLVVLIPLAILLLRPGERWRDLLRLGLGIVAGMLLFAVPFLLRDPAAFVDGILGFLRISMFRPDSLGFGPDLAPLVGGTVPLWVAPTVAAIATIVVLIGAPRTPSGFALASGVVLLATIPVLHQAFPNYYLSVVGALCGALAVALPEGSNARPAEAEATAEAEPAPPTDLTPAPVAMTEPAGRAG